MLLQAGLVDNLGADLAHDLLDLPLGVVLCGHVLGEPGAKRNGKRGNCEKKLL